jgi:hypothetical protein
MDRFIIRSTNKPLPDFWNPATREWQPRCAGCVFDALAKAEHEMTDALLLNAEVVPYLMMPVKELGRAFIGRRVK